MAAAFRSVVLVSVLAGLVPPAALQAQRRPQRPPEGGPGFLFHAPRVTFGVRGGFNLRRAGSSIYGLFTDTLTLGKSDFNAFSIAGDLGVIIAGPVELGWTRTTCLSLSAPCSRLSP